MAAIVVETVISKIRLQKTKFSRTKDTCWFVHVKEPYDTSFEHNWIELEKFRWQE